MLTTALVVDLMDQMIAIHQHPIDDFVMNQFCQLFPSEVKLVCNVAVNVYGKAIVDGLLRERNADRVCRDIKLCHNENCTLRPTPMSSIGEAIQAGNYTMTYPDTFTADEKEYQELLELTVEKAEHVFGTKGIWDWIKEMIQRVLEKKPVSDIDDDYFSTSPYLRGYNWRGRDCNDWDAKIYPGQIGRVHV